MKTMNALAGSAGQLLTSIRQLEFNFQGTKGQIGSCDIEKNRYIDIEKKISIISTISNYANEKTSFSQLACIRITNS